MNPEVKDCFRITRKLKFSLETMEMFQKWPETSRKGNRNRTRRVMRGHDVHTHENDGGAVREVIQVNEKKKREEANKRGGRRRGRTNEKGQMCQSTHTPEEEEDSRTDTQLCVVAVVWTQQLGRHKSENYYRTVLGNLSLNFWKLWVD